MLTKEQINQPTNNEVDNIEKGVDDNNPNINHQGWNGKENHCHLEKTKHNRIAHSPPPVLPIKDEVIEALIIKGFQKF